MNGETVKRIDSLMVDYKVKVEAIDHFHKACVLYANTQNVNVTYMPDMIENDAELFLTLQDLAIKLRATEALMQMVKEM